MEKVTKQKGEMIASEAIYGFCGWLTTRKEVTKMSSKHNCSPIAHRIKEFCEWNKLKEPRRRWEKRLIHPK